MPRPISLAIAPSRLIGNVDSHLDKTVELLHKLPEQLFLPWREASEINLIHGHRPGGPQGLYGRA